MKENNKVYRSITNVIKVFTLLIVGLILLSGCSDGWYRYPCQDPNNWENTECKPPVCSAAGACPEDLIDKKIVEDAQNNG